MRTLTTLLFAAAIALTACKKDEKKADPAKTMDAAPVAMAADAAAAAAVDGSANAAEPMANETGNCPSTIVGAETVVDEKAGTPEKVVLTITSKDALVVPTIRARTKHLVDVQGAPDTSIKHTGEGTGGGGGGLCPVFSSNGTQISSEDVDGGVKVTLVAREALQPSLLATVKSRIDEAKEWTQKNIKQTGEFGAKGGDGGLSGGHGGNRTGKGDASGPRSGGGGGKGTGGGGKGETK